jgi:hypothetical protein
MPPGIRGALSARRLLRRHQTGRHVWYSLDGIEVEGVVPRVLRVEQDVVVLRGPAVPRPPAVVVCPDDLVDERAAPEYPVEQHLAVVDLAIVEVDVQRAVRGQHAGGFLQARAEEAQVVVEGVLVRAQRDPFRDIAAPLEADPVTLTGRRRRHPDLFTPSGRAGVERGIDIDEVDAPGRERPEELEVVAEVDLVHRDQQRAGSDVVDRARFALVASAVCTAVELAVRLDPMAHYPDPAMVADRGKGGDRAFEAVEHVAVSGRDHLEGELVVVTAGFTSRHSLIAG